MSRRCLGDDRCARCYQRREACLCAEIPRLKLRTKLTLIMHAAEYKATTNTGRLLKLAIPECEVRLRGEKDRRFEPLELGEGSALFLYPTPESVELTPEYVSSLEGPVHLIVPDGTWRQAAKVYRREACLKSTQAVRLPCGPLSRYHLRKAPQPHCLSTVEATARALGLLEGPEIQKALEDLFVLMVKRTLETRTPDSWRAKGLIRNEAGEFMRRDDADLLIVKKPPPFPRVLKTQ